MPDDEYVALLRPGAAAWNGWRVEHHEAPVEGADLAGPPSTTHNP
jgi:hypothetical protein